MEDKKVEILSDEIHDIMKRPPHAIYRYGIYVMCGIIFIIFTGSFFFRYPDLIQGNIVITTENPPIWLVAKSTGKIRELYCNDNQFIKKGDLLAVIENTAVTQNVLQLITELNDCIITDTIVRIPYNIVSNIGEFGIIQASYSTFAKNVARYEMYNSFNLAKQEKESLKKQCLSHNKYIQNLKQQLNLKRQEINFSKMEYRRDSKLYEKGVISKSEIEDAEKMFLIKQQEEQQFESNVCLAELNLLQIQESIKQKTIQDIQEWETIFTDLLSSYQELQMNIEQWQQTYLLKAPQDGKVTFTSIWKKNQTINNGEKVFAIVSNNSGNMIGKVELNTNGAGKIKILQNVQIKVNGYPYLEYGFIKGKITNISLIPNDGIYIAEVSLPQGLISSNNKRIEFSGELNGVAEIITEERTLIERIYSPVIYIIKKFFFKPS